MSALTDAIRQKCDEIDAQTPGLQWPAAVDCLAGTPCPERGGLDVPNDYFQIKMGEYERVAQTFINGGHVLLGCSDSNWIFGPYVSPYCHNFSCFGTSFRHLIQAVSRPGIQNMLHRAGAVIIYGYVGNAIGQEMGPPGNRTETQMLGNIDYVLEGLAGWFTGKGVIVCGTPVAANYTADPNLTNARIGKVNQIIKARFGSKVGWSVVDANPQLAPGWIDTATQPLAPQYVEDAGSHLTKAGTDIVFNLVRAVLPV